MTVSAEECFEAAARYQGVNAGILRAFAIKENRRCDGTISTNKNGSTDTGCMQINSVHFGELARYGVMPQYIVDPCRNIFIGAWHYKRMITKYGDNAIAVGAYHSETPALRDPYAEDIKAICIKYRLCTF